MVGLLRRADRAAEQVVDGVPGAVVPPFVEIPPDGALGREVLGEIAPLATGAKQVEVEIDLPNPEDLLRPGMFASASIRVERADVLTLPAAAVATEGDVNEGYRDFCFVLEAGKLHRTPVEVGTRGDGRVQVLRKQVQGAWQGFSGQEQVVQGELSSLADGQRVKLAASRLASPRPLDALSRLDH